MNPRITRFLPFVLGAIMMLTLTAVLMRYRYEVEMDRETSRAHALLDDLGDALGLELNRGDDALNAAVLLAGDPAKLQALPKPHGWHGWRVNAAGQFINEPGGPAPLIAAASLERDLATHDGSRNPLILLGPYAAESGDNAVAIATPVRQPDGSAGWAGESILLRDLLPAGLTDEFVKQGFRLQMRNATNGAAEDLDEAESRRRSINLLYGKAIENVAALEARLQIVSMHDTVTGLANRSSLLRRIEVELESMRQSSSGRLGILAIGFEQLPQISSSFGAEFASRVLVVAAERVEFVLPSKDLLYRIGDSQLAVVVPSNESLNAAKLADLIIKEIEAPIAMDSHTFMLHPSIGIAETSSGYEYVEALLDHANTALSAVPRDTPTRYCVFDSATAKESVSRLQLEVDLNRAFDEHQFVLEYEPIVTPVTNTVAGFEALIRWDHPTEGRIYPSRFVEIAVQAGMSNRLNHWVMRETARQASLWYRAGYRDIFVNFNLSAEAFLKNNLEHELGEILAEFELPGFYLSVELTESTLIQDLRSAARTLQRLHELGIRAWLDDFGTGYSSLSYLRQLPLKGVKIDRSFIERTVQDSRDFGFVKSLIDLISYLGMTSIAEGIETQGQYELLSMTTCDLFQGYHFARSMAPDVAERWMIESGGVVKQAKRA
jgi:diguanylate cyclase (GGDEF)-like protein